MKVSLTRRNECFSTFPGDSEMNMNEEEAKQHARLCKEIEAEFGMTSEQFFEALHLAVVLGRLEKIKQMKGTK